MKNYYQILGLKNNASQEDIKRAYRKLALKFHPDKNVGDNFFDELFREIKEAYDILSNPISKREYDLKYDTFINNANARTNTTYQKRPAEKQQETHTPKPKSKKHYFEGIKNFNPKRFKNLSIKSKIKLLFQAVLFILPFIGIYLNGFLGFITVVGFYGSTFIFIYTVKNINKIDSVGGGFIGVIFAPVVAILIFGQGLDYFNINPFGRSQNNEKTENEYNPNIFQKEEAEKAKPTRELTETEVKMNELQEGLKELQKILPPDKYEKISKYRGNQLKNGESPFDDCFGKGIYSQDAWLKFDNSNKSDAVVCLVRSYDQKIIRNEYIRAGAKFEMSKIPSGTYYIKVYYGNDWNPNKKNFCGTNGAFERNESYSKSDKIGDYIKIENTDRSYTTGTITLYEVENGNMSSENIDEEDFFTK